MPIGTKWVMHGQRNATWDTEKEEIDGKETRGDRLRLFWSQSMSDLTRLGNVD